MSDKILTGNSSTGAQALDSLTNPEGLRDRDDVTFTTETRRHDDVDHCGVDVAGQAIAGIENDDSELLLLLNDELGVAVLPHASVERGDDWAAVARQGVENQTGISVTLDHIEAVRQVDHVVADAGKPHTTTHRVLFAGRPAGGEIHDCKRAASAGSDDWRAGWFTDLPDAIEMPGDGPGDDLQHFLG